MADLAEGLDLEAEGLAEGLAEDLVEVDFREDLVLPYREALRTFAPLTNPPGWSSRKDERPPVSAFSRATASRSYVAERSPRTD